MQSDLPHSQGTPAHHAVAVAAAPGTSQVAYATAAAPGDQLENYFVKTVDDLEQLKYGNTAPATYYIQPAPTAANVTQLAAGQQVQIQTQQVVAHHQQAAAQPRTSPRKHQKYAKYGNSYLQ